MPMNRLFALVVLLGFTMVTGCGGSSNPVVPPSTQSSQVSLTMIDAPPAGVTVLSFEVNVTGATLSPGAVDLLAGRGPIQIEVKRLEVETAFLSTANVAPNSYTSLNLTFANPQLTFRNDSNPPQMIAGCAPGTVCEFKPTGTLTTTVNISPALTIAASNPIGLRVDLKLDNILSNALGVDFSQPGNVTVAQLSIAGLPAGELDEVDEAFGKVANKSTNTFDLQTSQGILTGIQSDSNTTFDGFICAPVNFATCVQNSQIVQVDLKLMAGGVLLARKIEQENEGANEEDLEGIVTSVNAVTSTFQMVVAENLSMLSGVHVGSPVNVLVQPGAGFHVDQDGLTVNPALVSSFNGVNAMMLGQNIQVRRQGGDGSVATPILTDRVRLRMSRFTAKVQSIVDANTFTVDNLPPIFGGASPPIASITVSTDPARTRFEGVSSVAVLGVPPNADTVSLRGLLFQQPTGPTLVAKKVRKR